MKRIFRTKFIASHFIKDHPKCGTTMKFIAELSESKEPVHILQEVNSFLDLFRPIIRKNLDVTFENGHLSVEFKGKYDKKVFREITSVVRNCGGVWLKGHFVVPTEKCEKSWGKFFLGG